MIKKIKEDPFILIDIIIGTLSVILYSFIYDFRFGEKMRIIGYPIIDIRKKSKIIIGRNVTLRSRNRGYHINISSRVKLFTNPNAEISIGDNSRIYGSCIHASKKITIGNNVLIAGNVNIIDNNGHELLMNDPSKRINSYGISNEVIIGNDCWIGANSIITPGTILGDGTVVMANSLVSGVFKEKSLIGGVPAKLLKQY
jgi:acetyltransferase-like isoleucine patch superfamily enzyme